MLRHPYRSAAAVLAVLPLALSAQLTPGWAGAEPADPCTAKPDGRIVSAADSRWVVLRLTDPRQRPDDRAPSAYASSGSAIAYAAPFFLEP